MPKSETFEKGAVIRRQLMGDALAGKLSNTVYKAPAMENLAITPPKPSLGRLGIGPALTTKR